MHHLVHPLMHPLIRSFDESVDAPSPHSFDTRSHTPSHPPLASHCFKLLRARGVSYKEAVLRETAPSPDDPKSTHDDVHHSREGQISHVLVDVNDVVNSLIALFNLPMLPWEVHLALTKHTRRGKVNVAAFLDAFDGGTGTSGTRGDGSSLRGGGGKDENNEHFVKTLFKKLCMLRANEAARVSFRKAMLQVPPTPPHALTFHHLHRPSSLAS